VLGFALCVLLVVHPVRWLARRGADDPDGDGDRDADDPADGGAGTGLRGQVAATMRPVLISPFGSDGPPVPWARSAIVSLAVGVAALLTMGPLVALAATAVTLLALAVRRGEVLLRIVSLGALAAAALFIVAKEARNHFVVDFDWMNKFEVTHAWGLIATALLAVDPLVEVLRRRRGRDDPR
jgi:hypothetical protein